MRFIVMLLAGYLLSAIGLGGTLLLSMAAAFGEASLSMVTICLALIVAGFVFLVLARFSPSIPYPYNPRKSHRMLERRAA